MSINIPLGRVGCSAAIIKDRKILLTKRAPGMERFPGCWTFPAGGIESTDETLEDCVKREVKEEVGLSFEPTGKFGFYQSLVHGRRNLSLVFLGNWTGELVWQPEEVSEGDFFSHAQSLDLEMAFAYREVVDDLKTAGLID